MPGVRVVDISIAVYITGLRRQNPVHHPKVLRLTAVYRSELDVRRSGRPRYRQEKQAQAPRKPRST